MPTLSGFQRMSRGVEKSFRDSLVDISTVDPTSEEGKAILTTNIRTLNSTYHSLMAELDKYLDNVPKDISEEMMDNTYHHIMRLHSTLTAQHEVLLYGIPATAKVRQFTPSANSTEIPVKANETNLLNLTQVNLPKLKLPFFDGEDISLFDNFMARFDSLIIKSPHFSNLDRLEYLLDHLQGPAHKVTSHLEFNEANFDVAIKLLKERYSNPRSVISIHANGLLSLPCISNKPESIRNFLDLYNSHYNSLQNHHHVKHVEDVVFSQFVLSKFSQELRDKFELRLPETSDFPDLATLIKFLQSHVVSLENSIIDNSPNSSYTSVRHFTSADNQCKFSKTKRNKTKSTTASLSVAIDNCNICQISYHLIDKCSLFLSKTPEERFQLVKSNRICPRCLQAHSGSNCKTSSRCSTCKSRGHHSLLHFNKAIDSGNKTHSLPLVSLGQPSTSSPASCITCNSSARSNISANVLMATCLIKLQSKSGQYVIVRAILDTASQVSFISEHCAQMLKCHRIPISSSVKGVGSIQTSTKGLVKLSVQSLNGEIFHHDNSFLILDRITTDTPCFSVSSDINNKVKHLKLADPTFDVTSPIDCLLGANLAALILSGNVISLGNGYPLAVETKLGFVLMGSTPTTQQSVNANELEFQTSHVSLATDINQELLEAVNRFWAVEEPKPCSKLSPDEQLCERYFQETTVRLPSGRFQVRLPFKSDMKDALGNSYDTALKRLKLLERKFDRDPHFKGLYFDFMKTYALEGHMIPYSGPGPSKYIIPHHGIFKSHGDVAKIRVVFDASSRTNGNQRCSLNDTLYPGPKLQSNISDVLLHFRLNNFVWVCDIEQCFRQIQVHPDDQPYQCILWRESISDPIQVMALTTVTYGTASAPYLSERTLHELAVREASTHPQACQVLLKNRYVDDMHGGGHTLDSAISLRDDFISLLSSGGFTLKKWAANHPKLLSGISDSHILPISSNKCVKVLGMDWIIDDDVIQFPIEEMFGLKDSSVTKRKVLSDTARLYDPCGLISPVVIKAKIFLQQLWRRNLDWDTSLPPDDQETWCSFINSLSALKGLRIPRPINVYSSNIQLHGFCDASMHGYAASLYLRILHEGGYKCYLIASRTRVAPLKPITIPRLELMGAHLLSKTFNNYFSILSSRIAIDSCVLWTDSTIVLDWLKTQPHLLKTFVGNRVSQIHDWTSFCSWNHVSGMLNPCDIASRSISAPELVSNRVWWEGPSFLSKDSSSWPSPVFDKSHSDEDLELKSPSSLIISSESSDQLLFTNISSWIKLLKIVSIIMKWKYIGKHQSFDSFSLRQTAIFVTLRYVQRTSSLVEDIKALRTGKPASKAVQRLNPFIDEHDVLRSRGRLSNAISYCDKLPIILPKRHFIVSLLICNYHVWLGHAGPSQVQFQLSLSYWILAARQVIRKVVHQCVTCFRIRPKPTFPLMGDLPACRVNPAPPFHHTGMDYCGPFVLKSSKLRKAPLLKGYLCIFVCMATKAIHLEVAQDLTALEFIDCIKRLIGRRGAPRVLYSDCGTNFVGASTILQRQLKALLSNNSTSQLILDFALENNFKFEFSCPAAPHQGGLWERAVRSTKYHLKRIIGSHILTLAQFSSLTIQIEGILNSRPLTPLSSEPNDYQVLTPGHFLIGRPLTAPPSDDLSLVNDGTLRHHQLIQALLQRFWNHWRVEYLSTLRARSKWTSTTPNLSVGDLVVMDEPNTPPTNWPLGRVIQVFPGKDGIVRRAFVKTKSGQYERPVVKLYRLPLSETELTELANKIIKDEVLLTETVKEKVLSSLVKLQERLKKELNSSYVCRHYLKNHDLPIAGVALNKEGTKCITGSFDHTCSIWDTESGLLVNTVNCHTGAVYAVAFNDPYGDRIITGSFDKTACISDANTGHCLTALCGHRDEVVVVKYEPVNNLVGTASLDKTAKIYDAKTGDELWTISGHDEAIVALHFNNEGNQILTGSFDSNIFMWDRRAERKVASFLEHSEEVSNCMYNFDCSMIGSGAVDKTARIWDVRNHKCLYTITHEDEVLDVDFDFTGRKFATAGSEGHVKLFDLSSGKLNKMSPIIGHQKEVSKVSFSPGGGLILTGSSDGTCRIWITTTGQCTQILVHKNEIFNCKFSYDCSLIVTVGNDAVCKLWKQSMLNDDLGIGRITLGAAKLN